MVSSKSAIQKIIVEDDFRKSPLYTLTQEDQHVSNLFTETDTRIYKQKVCILIPVFSMLIPSRIHSIEAKDIHQRRPLSAGFSISFLNAMEPLMKSCVDFMVEILESRCITNTESEDGRAVVDMFCMLGNLTMDVMSATLFGGSFGLVINEDPHVKNLFLDRLRRVYIDVILPFVKYIPFIPSPVQEMDRMIDGIIKTRRAEMRRGTNGVGGEKAKEKKDLLQIFLDANESDPTGFTDKHLMEEMRLFMYALLLIPHKETPNLFAGSLAAIQQGRLALLHFFSCSTILPNYTFLHKKSSLRSHPNTIPSPLQIHKICRI